MLSQVSPLWEGVLWDPPAGAAILPGQPYGKGSVVQGICISLLDEQPENHRNVARIPKVALFCFSNISPALSAYFFICLSMWNSFSNDYGQTRCSHGENQLCSSTGFRSISWDSAADGFHLLSAVRESDLEFRPKKILREPTGWGTDLAPTYRVVNLATWKLWSYLRLTSLKMSLESGPVVPELLQSVINSKRENEFSLRGNK